jgi:hypothetical protein
MNIIKSTIRLRTIAAVVVIVAFAVGWWAEFDTQRARLALEKANIANAGPEQKPPPAPPKEPAPPKNMCPLSSIAPSDDADVLFYPDDTPDCLHRPNVDPLWHRALVSHLHKYRRYPSDTTLFMVVLSFTVDRGGHVLNPEVVTLYDLRGTARNSALEDQAISMIDRPLPPFPDSRPSST